MAGAPGPTTRVFALLGDPVAHSLSPRLHNAALRAEGIDGVYVALRVPAGDVAGLIRGLAHAGGGGNVTLPHKLLAATVVDEPTPAVTRTGACNTFWLERGRVRGDNTDVAAFAAVARGLTGALDGKRALLVGAGGAARAAACGLLDENAAEVVVLNRTRERALQLVRALGAGSRLRVVGGPGELRGESFDVIVNATSLGLQGGDAAPVDLGAFAHVGAALDLVYHASGTRWTRAARQAGIPCADGTEMLVLQAAAAFRLWHGRDAPLDVMRRALTAG